MRFELRRSNNLKCLANVFVSAEKSSGHHPRQESGSRDGGPTGFKGNIYVDTNGFITIIPNMPNSFLFTFVIM